MYLNEKTNTLPKIILRNKVIEDICKVEDEVARNDKLVDSMFKLKAIDLLKPRENKLILVKNQGRVTFVYNDYHSRHTNPGYKRSDGGLFFVKWFFKIYMYYLYCISY